MPLHPSLLTSIAPIPSGPDAEIIEACNRFAAMEVQRHVPEHATEGYDPDFLKVYENAYQAVLEGRATTPKGFYARARAVAMYIEPDEPANGTGRWSRPCCRTCSGCRRTSRHERAACSSLEPAVFHLQLQDDARRQVRHGRGPDLARAVALPLSQGRARAFRLHVVPGVSRVMVIRRVQLACYSADAGCATRSVVGLRQSRQGQGRAVTSTALFSLVPSTLVTCQAWPSAYNGL